MKLIHRLISALLLIFAGYDKSFEYYDKHVIGSRYIYLVVCSLIGKGSVEAAFSKKEEAEKYIEREGSKGMLLMTVPIDYMVV